MIAVPLLDWLCYRNCCYRVCPRLLYQARGLRVVLLLVGYKVQGPSSGRTRRAVIPNPARCYPSSSWSRPDLQSGVDTIFWHVSKKVISVKKRWPIWKKPKDAQCWNRLMESVRWTRGICREDADLSVLVFGGWVVADEVKEGGEDPDSTRILMIRL